MDSDYRKTDFTKYYKTNTCIEQDHTTMSELLERLYVSIVSSVESIDELQDQLSQIKKEKQVDKEEAKVLRAYYRR